MATKKKTKATLTLELAAKSPGQPAKKATVELTREGLEGLIQYMEDIGEDFDGKVLEALFAGVGLLKPQRWYVELGAVVMATTEEEAIEIAQEKYPDAELQDIWRE